MINAQKDTQDDRNAINTEELVEVRSDSGVLKNNTYDQIYKQIIKVVDEKRVKTDQFERRLYSHDVASLPKMMDLGFKFTPDLVVRPNTSKEISEIINIARKKFIPIIPRGGASWGLGGAVPVKGGIVLDTTSLNKIIEIDEDNLVVTVESGISWKSLYDTLFQKGYIFFISLIS